ncbi:hypothetical protein CVT25_013164 [Psilocybe cyanescens]|uniref:Winged helix-turn helix domain-containing protein n=1 Tax=Psilocybe cyanescens TaxID=93625 RepID=A0A409X0F5_PSICY|nr:hypothetical protein CVT25_013164 [Psilocybe cyanescens]
MDDQKYAGQREPKKQNQHLSSIKKKISHKTACCYLNSLGYHYKATPKDQYADGHERDDVVFYQKNVFLPQWHHIQKGWQCGMQS